MKKLILIAGLALLTACSADQTIESETEAITTTNKQLEIVVDGRVRTLNFTESDGELTLIEDEAFAKVNEVFNSSDLITVINSEVDKVLFFSNEAQLQEFQQEPQTLSALSEKYGTLKEAVPSATPKSSTLKFRIARAHSLGGPAYTINASTGRYYNRHLLRNQCTTGNIDFDNEISSFKVYQGGTVEFHEDPDYGGKRIRVQAVNQDVYIADLADLKKKTFTIIDGSFDPNFICNRWALCFTSFNDKITSITAARFGLSLQYTRVNNCGGGGGGTGGSDEDPIEYY
ncbi:hypothetical protein [Gilvibacter sp.]|uniref:hypothetical protein n=1 Tax=Gilvibacter sp. TaxID=2729997 RepID=UPI003F4A34F9